MIRYRRDDVVAVLDSTRAGETMEGLPIVATVNDALCFNPTTALVGVATSGGRFPPRVARAAEERDLQGPRRRERPARVPEPRTTSCASSRGRHGVELRDLRKPPPDLNVPTGENLEVPARIVATVGSDCAIGKKTVALELDLEARRRGAALAVRPHRPDGDRDRRLGNRGRRGDLRLPRGRGRAARRRGPPPGRGGRALRRGPGLARPPAYAGVTLGLLHGSVPHALVLCHLAGATEIDGYPGHPLPSLPELIELYERASLPARRARVAAIALNTRHLDDDAARAAAAAAEAETGLPADDPVRFGAGKLLDAVT